MNASDQGLCLIRSGSSGVDGDSARNDGALLTLDALFALSNGYIIASAMMAAPQLVAPELRNRAGMLMVLLLLTGLTLGAFLGEAFTALL